MKKPELKPRLILYVDILGFKDMLNEMRKGGAEKTVESLEIYRIITEIMPNQRELNRTKFKDFPGEADFKKIDLQYCHFSDTIVVSIGDTSDDALLQLCQIALNITNQMAILKMCVRGSLHIGDLWHEGNSIFGPGIADAYYLEDNCAIYPRIIISDQLIEHVGGPEMGLLEHSYLTRDSDFYYVDYIAKTISLDNYNIDRADIAIPLIGKQITTISKLIAHAYEKEQPPKVIQKYKWLERKMHDYINYLRNLGRINNLQVLYDFPYPPELR